MDVKKDALRFLTRRKLNTDNEQLRERVSREKKRVIKLHVGQDTAYWDLQQRNQQLEASHERLQQNMVDLQMQYENTSGQYQNEVKQREEVLNKVENTRLITNVLEDYFNKVNQTLSSGQNDMKPLCKGYDSFCVSVQELKRQVARAEERHKIIVENHQEMVKMQANQIDQLQQCLSIMKEQAMSEINELRAQNEAAKTRVEKLTKDYNELNLDMKERMMQLEQRDQKILSLDTHLKLMMQEYDENETQKQKVLMSLEKQLKEQKEKYEVLQKALANQEEFTNKVREENNTLQDKLAATEDEFKIVSEAKCELNGQLQNLAKSLENMQLDVKFLKEKRTQLEAIVHEQRLTISNAETEILGLKQQVTSSDKVKAEQAAVIHDLKKQLDHKNSLIDNSLKENQEIHNKLKELEANHDAYQTSNENCVADLKRTLNVKNDEIKAQLEAITLLKTTVETLEQNIEEHIKKHEADKATIAQLSQELEDLHLNVQFKDNQIIEKSNTIDQLNAELENMAANVNDKDAKIKESTVSLNNKEQEIEQLKEDIADLKSKIDELNQMIEAKNIELDSKTAMISQLMSDVKVGTDVQAKLQAEKSRLLQDVEIINALRSKLEESLKEKDIEFGKQTSIIMELRGDKERLMEQYLDLEGRIENVQRGLAAPGRPRQLLPAELDDNAVLTPARKLIPRAPTSPVLKGGGLQANKMPDFEEARVFNIFSESSESFMTVEDVNRQFNRMSRGERPTFPSSVKKRRRSSVPEHQITNTAPAHIPAKVSEEKREPKPKERLFFKTKKVEKKKP